MHALLGGNQYVPDSQFGFSVARTVAAALLEGAAMFPSELKLRLSVGLAFA